jgi:hypothetical protein
MKSSSLKLPTFLTLHGITTHICAWRGFCCGSMVRNSLLLFVMCVCVCVCVRVCVCQLSHSQELFSAHFFFFFFFWGGCCCGSGGGHSGCTGHIRLFVVLTADLGRSKAMPLIFDSSRQFIERSPRTNGKVSPVAAVVFGHSLVSVIFFPCHCSLCKRRAWLLKVHPFIVRRM